MTTSTTVTKTSGLTVINLKVTKEGNIERKMTDVSPQAQLNNTLLEALCPGIRVASVTVTPEPLDQVERARVESALSRFNVDGIDYRLIGASGSAKSGKYYAVDARFERSSRRSLLRLAASCSDVLWNSGLSLPGENAGSTRPRYRGAGSRIGNE